MTAGHRAYVSTTNTGNGRLSHSYACTCGKQGGGYSSRSAARDAANKHEGRRR
jgi:hypothetical protein